MSKHQPRTSSQRDKKTPRKLDDYFIHNLGMKQAPKKNKAHNASNTIRAKIRVHPLSLFSAVSRDSKSNTGAKVAQLMKRLGIDNMNANDYLPAIIDRPQLVSVKNVDLLKQFGGKGLFAEKDISKDTCLGVYMGAEFTIEQFMQHLSDNKEADNQYAMKIGRTIVDARVKGNFTRYINCSDGHANVEFVESTVNNKKVVKVVTTSEIKEGQQILVDYNIYQEESSKLYLFLNPSDGWLSAYELYKENQALYQHLESPSALPLLDVKQNDSFYVTQVARIIFDNRVLSKKIDMLDSASINLPCLRADKKNRIIDFNKADAFTPLMLACYLGQYDNVKWLLGKGAEINQQQSHSGNCPLFFALEGYAAATSKREKKVYFNIIILLIENNASVLIHDRADKLFLHKAVSVLSVSDLKFIITKLNNNDSKQLKETFNFIDENDDDFVLLALRYKQIDKFEILLQFHPDYFDTYSKRANKRNIEQFKDAIKNYNDDEKSGVLRLLKSDLVNISNRLLVQLGFDVNESAHRNWFY